MPNHHWASSGLGSSPGSWRLDWQGNLSRDPRQTWRYFAQAVIQEEDPEKFTRLMQELYRVLNENEELPVKAF
jgi:hypothetical protein